MAITKNSTDQEVIQFALDTLHNSHYASIINPHTELDKVIEMCEVLLKVQFKFEFWDIGNGYLEHGRFVMAIINNNLTASFQQAEGFHVNYIGLYVKVIQDAINTNFSNGKVTDEMVEVINSINNQV